MTTDEYVPDTEAELGSWMTRAYEAEGKLWQAERRITRLEAQTDIRGRAVVMYRERAREAEAQIEAVQDVLDNVDDTVVTEADGVHVPVYLVRRTLDT